MHRHREAAPQRVNFIPRDFPGFLKPNCALVPVLEFLRDSSEYFYNTSLLPGLAWCGLCLLHPRRCSYNNTYSKQMSLPFKRIKQWRRQDVSICCILSLCSFCRLLSCQLLWLRIKWIPWSKFEGGGEERSPPGVGLLLAPGVPWTMELFNSYPVLVWEREKDGVCPVLFCVAFKISSSWLSCARKGTFACGIGKVSGRSRGLVPPPGKWW